MMKQVALLLLLVYGANSIASVKRIASVERIKALIEGRIRIVDKPYKQGNNERRVVVFCHADRKGNVFGLCTKNSTTTTTTTTTTPTTTTTTTTTTTATATTDRPTTTTSGHKEDRKELQYKPCHEEYICQSLPWALIPVVAVLSLLLGLLLGPPLRDALRIRKDAIRAVQEAVASGGESGNALLGSTSNISTT
uniref:Uncharacterized protein n=1 Tax=Steinernema glaseri TaxID=37863 RepID=A0A1I7ZJ71_9BILA